MNRNQRRAAAKLGQATGGVPNPGDAHIKRASELGRSGRFVEALVAFDKALALRPGSPEAWLGRGNCLMLLERLQESVAAYEKALSLRLDYFEAWGNLGNVLFKLERDADAVAAYDRALALQPRHAPAWLGRANLMVKLQRYQEASVAFDRALEADPSLAEAWLGRGNLLRVLGLYRDALAAFDRALALKADLARAWSGRGAVLYSMNDYGGALAAWTRTLELAPDRGDLEADCLLARMFLCDWTDFDLACARVRALVNAGQLVEPFAFTALPSTPAEQLRCARLWTATRHPAVHGRDRARPRYGHERIHLAYLSADFRDHPVAHLTAGLFARHDRSRFETFGISLRVDRPSQMRERQRTSFDRFLDVHAMSDQAVAELLRDLEIDIAIDLTGITEGGRPNIFAHRPVPVQVNYLGYPGTLGQDYCDYIIADRFIIPEDRRADFAERVVYLPDTFMVNDADRPISAVAPTRAEAGLPERGFVFCCFNNSYKITPDIYDVWMRLLKAVEGSVLWLSTSNASACDNLRREAERRGVCGERLVFAPKLALIEDHLARHRVADLFVDTLHYNAHATAADALWTGLPVVTCAGTTFASRVAGSLLRAVGLPELVAASVGDYEELALALAREPERLAAVRQRLARNRLVCPLFDTDRFTRHLEAAYATMMERQRAGLPPDHIRIGDSWGDSASGS
jgi:protein O-GlcNAc transferase